MGLFNDRCKISASSAGEFSTDRPSSRFMISRNGFRDKSCDGSSEMSAPILSRTAHIVDIAGQIRL